jgi:signal transduction histidine kinase
MGTKICLGRVFSTPAAADALAVRFARGQIPAASIRADPGPAMQNAAPHEPYVLPPGAEDAIRDPVRLRALHATGLLDTPPEEAFDRLTRLAATFLGVPLAMVNLVDERRHFSKSCLAPPDWKGGTVVPLADTCCKLAVIDRAPVAIEDTRLDPRVRHGAMVTRGNVLSYLGVPIILSTGQALGTLCVAGFQPRHWTEAEVKVMQDLTAGVTTEVELRLDAAYRRQMERLKDELVSIVAHELRTPLTSIRGSLGLLASGKLDPRSSQGQRLVEIAAQNSDRLVRLVNDMLDLERLESGALGLEQAATPADRLVEQAVDAVRGAAQEAGVRLAADVRPDLALWADADRAVQVLVNLLSNAVKFSPAGAQVRVTAERRGDEALFQVRDRGRGIPHDQLEAIFERFRQVDSSDARKKGGTGLGLAISRSIVHQHGGRIWVASALGQGSTFFFTLPLARGGPPSQPLG